MFINPHGGLDIVTLNSPSVWFVGWVLSLVGTPRLRINFCQRFKILEGTTEQFCKPGLLYKADFTGVAVLVSFFAFLPLHIQFVLKLKKNL